MLPKPVKIQTTDLIKIPGYYTQAAMQASDCITIEGDEPVRIETYKTKEIAHLVETIWKWPASLTKLKCHPDDVQRVKKIISLIEGGSPQWPYVSYWADTFTELWDTDEYEGETSVLNHGDGWHRIIAAAELKLPTIPILFLP